MYLSKIEEYFSRYGRHGTILSPQNWLIAERWEKMGIPINIVCKGIKKTCRQFRSAHKTGQDKICLLTYCEPEILRLWKDYRKALLGAPDDNKEDKVDQPRLPDIIRKRLETIRNELRDGENGTGPWGAIKSKALARIDWSNELDLMEKEYCDREKADIEVVEKGLKKLDKAYLDSIFPLLSKKIRSELNREIEEELFPYKDQMESGIYKETFEIGVESLLRERLNLGRISLYAT